MNRAYIDSLEAGFERKVEAEWREIIEKEIADMKAQTGEDPDIDIDEVIGVLEDEGFVYHFDRDILIRERIYDESNGRYITPDGVGADPRVFSCVVEEMDENGDFYIAGRQLFRAEELKRLKKNWAYEGLR